MLKTLTEEYNAQAWRSYGLPMSTSSDEACKLFDASLTQLVNHYDDPAVGGLEPTMEKMMAADPDFIMGHVLKQTLSGKHMHLDFKFAEEIYKLSAMSEQQHVTPWERKHVQALRLMASGEMGAASLTWENILVEYPLDMLSLKMLTEAYISKGTYPQLRDSIGRVLPLWKPDMPFYGDLLGMHAFGLEETNFYVEAEKQARKALEIFRGDSWAAHAIAHVREMTGQYKSGIEFMASTENDWSESMLACHNYWHWALFHFEAGDFDTAVGFLDKKILPSMTKSGSTFNLTDAAALLRRLQQEGVDVGSRWDEVYEVGRSHTEDNSWVFSDLNVLMTCLGAQKKDVATKMIAKMNDFVRNGSGDIRKVYRHVAIPMAEAFQAYEDGQYGAAVDILKPIRYSFIEVGGSHAQRDVFELFLLHAAIRSNKPEHQKFAKSLLLERQSFKGESPMVERLLSKLVISHGD